MCNTECLVVIQNATLLVCILFAMKEIAELYRIFSGVHYRNGKKLHVILLDGLLCKE